MEIVAGAQCQIGASRPRAVGRDARANSNQILPNESSIKHEARSSYFLLQTRKTIMRIDSELI